MSAGRIWKYCNVVDPRTSLCAFIATLYPLYQPFLDGVFLTNFSHIHIFLFWTAVLLLSAFHTRAFDRAFVGVSHMTHLQDKYAVPLGGDKDWPGAAFAHEITYTLQSGVIYLLCPPPLVCAGAGVQGGDV